MVARCAGPSMGGNGGFKAPRAPFNAVHRAYATGAPVGTGRCGFYRSLFEGFMAVCERHRCTSHDTLPSGTPPTARLLVESDAMANLFLFCLFKGFVGGRGWAGQREGSGTATRGSVSRNVRQSGSPQQGRMLPRHKRSPRRHPDRGRYRLSAEPPADPAEDAGGRRSATAPWEDLPLVSMPCAGRCESAAPRAGPSVGTRLRASRHGRRSPRWLGRLVVHTDNHIAQILALGGDPPRG